MYDSTQKVWPKNRSAAIAVLMLLAIHAALGTHSAFHHSVTGDEFWHIPTGLWNVTHGRFHYENLNPPLLRGLAALPLLAVGAETGEVAEDADKETRSDAFVAANRERYSWLVSIARLVPLLISVWTGWILATWALELFGPGAAVLGAAMWSLSPNVLAHSPLVTTDVPAAGAMLVVMRLAWKFSGEPTIRKAVWLGVWLGIAQLVKFTCLLLVPLVVITWIIRRSGSRRMPTVSVLTTIVSWVVVASLCLLTINGGYLFRDTGRPLGEYRFQCQALQAVAALCQPCADWPVPFPADYVEGIDHQRHIMEGAHPSYLDGELRLDGFREYYIMAWWYKAPHAIQLLCALSVLGILWPWRRDRQWRLQFVLLLPLLLLFWVASLSSMQLGIRYLLPAYPFLFLLASQLGSVGHRKWGLPQIAAILLVAGTASSLRHHPDHIPYFNELAGGPTDGHLHLLDSNVDWGQGLLELKAWLAARDIAKVRMAYFGVINPADIGIPFEPIPQAHPPETVIPRIEPGVYVISANFLMGRPGMMRDPNGEIRISGPHQLGYFRYWAKPDEVIANCMFVYDLSEEDIARVLQNGP